MNFVIKTFFDKKLNVKISNICIRHKHNVRGDRAGGRSSMETRRLPLIDYFGMSFLKKRKAGRKSIEENQRSFNDAVITLGKNLEEEKKEESFIFLFKELIRGYVIILISARVMFKKIRANNEQLKDLKIGKEKLRKYEIDGFDVQIIRKMIHDHIKNH